jgi:hypothetical protein
MTTERIIRVTIPGYKEHQRDIKKREYLALDMGFFSNRKVRQAKRECLDSVYCYQWLWANVDYETESIEIKESALKAEWMVECACQSNRFDLLKRLQALSNAGLIGFEFIPNESLIDLKTHSNEGPMTFESDSKTILTESELHSNESQTSFQSESNEVLNDFKHPLEPSETRVALLDININNLVSEEKELVVKTEKNSALTARARELPFEVEVLIAEGCKYFQKHLPSIEADWIVDYLAQQFGLLRYRDDMRPEDFISCWFEAVDSGKRNNAQASKWFKTGFESKLFDWKPKAKPGRSSVLKIHPFIQAWKDDRSFYLARDQLVYPSAQLTPWMYNLRRAPFEGEKPDSFKITNGSYYKFEDFTMTEETS